MHDSAEFEGVLGDLEGMDEGVLRGQIERAHLVAQLTEHPGWALLCDYLTALTVSSQHRVLGGAANTMEEYRSLIGFISGLQKAIDAPKTLLERVTFLQEQAEQAKQPSDPLD